MKNIRYELEGLTYEGPGSVDGDRRFVYAQRNEGETYTFRVRAHTAGDWSDQWSNTATTTCNPLNPMQLEHPDSAEGRSVSWASPNAKFVDPLGFERRHGHNPVHVRYMMDETKNPGLGRDNCTAAIRNQADDGWTRTCTIFWTEPLAIELDHDVVRQLEGHTSTPSIPIIHDEGIAHLYVNSDGFASVAPHRHCDEDHDGDGTIDGTCRGADLAHAPDLEWHPLLPSPGDTWWKNAAEAQVIGGGAGALGGAIVGAAVGNVPGAIAGFFIGGVASFATAWLHSKDDNVSLVINGASGCLFDLWEQKSHTVEETFEAGGYETKINHEIKYCERSGS